MSLLISFFSLLNKEDFSMKKSESLLKRSRAKKTNKNKKKSAAAKKTSFKRSVRDVSEHPNKIFQSAQKALKRAKNPEEKAILADKYSFFILREIDLLFFNKPWSRSYQKEVCSFLISAYSVAKTPLSNYFRLASLYCQQVLKIPFVLVGQFFKKNWEKIFDYHLNKETLVIKFFKKTFHLKLTRFTRFFVRHMLHFKNDVDLVYLFCDGNDLKWRARKYEALKKSNPNWTANGLDKSRSANNNELKYSLRSAEMYAPWIHKIYIITDGQKPEWLNTSNKKIKIVDLKEMMPAKYLPCFNSNVIESFMYKIKGLSEYFLYANDDMFFASPTTKDFFFSADGKPYARFNKMPAVYKIIDSPYLQTLVRMSHLYEEKSGKKYFLNSHHNIDTYTKSFFLRTEKLFAHEMKIWRQNQFRTVHDFQRILLLYQALGENTAILKFHPRGYYKESRMFRVYDQNITKELSIHQTKLFCINDDEKTTDIDRKNIQKTYQNLFPYRSSFEK